MFKGILLNQNGKLTEARLTQFEDAQLPPGDVTVRVEWSTLNYKDALAITGRGAIVRKWPMVPGIDLAGVVEASSDPAWKAGDSVVVTGWGLGESEWGGLAQKARLPLRTLFRLPAGFTARESMIIGTAGVTAALAVLALQRHGLKPGDGDVVVTGAAGGVGSIAVALLSALGFNVTASTGRPSEAAYLSSMGAATVINRSELSMPGKALQSERWAGAVDSLGSHTLANLCAATRWNGAVAACGLAQGADFPSTVMPFILRGVTLYGINSVFPDKETRQAAWELLSHIDREKLAKISTEISLTEIIDYAPRVLDGQVRGRTIVNLNA